MTATVQPWMPHRDRMWMQIRSQILRHAISQVRSGGWPALNARAVARELGMTPPNVWVYFQNLAGLRAAVMQELVGSLTETAQGAYSDLPPRVVVARALADLGASNPVLLGALCDPQSPCLPLLVDALRAYEQSAVRAAHAAG